MSSLQVCLFGKFDIRYDEQVLPGLGAHKVQELFSYLLLYRGRPHSREILADLLWGNVSTTQSKCYLRKALWQLQSALDVTGTPAANQVLLVEPDWVQLNPEANLWLDTAVLEHAFTLVKRVPCQKLDERVTQALQSAVALYRGDLLEGWYSDWCMYERERFQHVYLALLDRLIDYCELHEEYEAGIIYGLNALRYDRARESTHRKLMRLQHLAGNRTAALRQYESCVLALAKELGVKPTVPTVTLYEQIRTGRSLLEASEEARLPEIMSLPEVLDQLEQLQMVLTMVQHELQKHIEVVKLTVNNLAQ